MTSSPYLYLDGHHDHYHSNRSIYRIIICKWLRVPLCIIDTQFLNLLAEKRWMNVKWWITWMLKLESIPRKLESVVSHHFPKVTFEHQNYYDSAQTWPIGHKGSKLLKINHFGKIWQNLENFEKFVYGRSGSGPWGLITFPRSLFNT